MLLLNVEFIVTTLVMLAGIVIFGLRCVSYKNKWKNLRDTYTRQMDAVSKVNCDLDRRNQELEKHNQDLNNALNTNSKVLDERAAAVLDMKFKVVDLERNLENEKQKFSNLLNQKKSSEVRVGLIGEQIAPFLDAWPFDTKNFRFMGAPIDGISFEPDGVVLVEIKTGKAALSPKQRQIRKQVREGKVKFMEFRIEEDGYRCKTD